MRWLKIFCLSILIASPLALSANAQSPSPRPRTDSSAPLSAETYAKTANAESKDSSSKSPKESQDLSLRDWLQIFFNFWLTVATIALAIFTWRLVSVTRDVHKATEKGTEVANENVKAAKASAEAAKAQLEFTKAANEQNLTLANQSNDIALVSARSATTSAETSLRALRAERPYLLVVDTNIFGIHATPIDISTQLLMAATQPVTNPSPFPITPALPGFLGANLSFKNFGKGPAILSYVVAKLSVVDALPEPKDFSRCQLMELTLKVISPDQPWMVPVSTLPFFISEEDSKIVRTTRAKRVIVYGCVYYRDLLDQPYETGFCWAFEPRTEQGILSWGSVDKTIEIPTHSYTK